MPLRKNASNFAGLRLQIEYLDPRQLVPAENRTRKHSKVKIKKLARSIADHGMLLPIRINTGGRVLGGHALLEAALSLNEANVPVVRIEHLTREQERLFAIAENKLTEGSSWDVDALRIEFEQISLAEPTLDLGRSGFEIAERDIIIGNHQTKELADLDDAVPLMAADFAVSRVGDLYRLGRDRGVISLSSLVDGNGCRVIVSDDGIGLPENASWPQSGKLGAVIAQSLRQNAKATLEVHSTRGEGVRVEIFFARGTAEPVAL